MFEVFELKIVCVSKPKFLWRSRSFCTLQPSGNNYSLQKLFFTSQHKSLKKWLFRCKVQFFSVLLLTQNDIMMEVVDVFLWNEKVFLCGYNKHVSSKSSQATATHFFSNRVKSILRRKLSNWPFRIFKGLKTFFFNKMTGPITTSFFLVKRRFNYVINNPLGNNMKMLKELFWMFQTPTEFWERKFLFLQLKRLLVWGFNGSQNNSFFPHP